MKPMLRFYVGGMLAAFGVLGLPAIARSGENCKAPESTVAIENCQQIELAAANGRINTTYANVMASISVSRQASLRRQERAWIASRDATCKVKADSGSSGPLIAGNCLISLTKARTRTLAAMVP